MLHKKEESKANKYKSTVILDSNIIEYCSDPNCETHFIPTVLDLRDERGLQLMISQYSHFELDGDKIIAATAVIAGTYIFTANRKDFPHPYFIEQESYNVVCYRKKRKSQYTVTASLIRPNFDLIIERFNGRPKKK